MCSLLWQHGNIRAKFFYTIFFLSNTSNFYQYPFNKTVTTASALPSCLDAVYYFQGWKCCSCSPKQTGKTVRNMASPMEMKITSHIWDLDKVSLSFNLRLCFDGSVILFSPNDMACDTPVVNLAPMVGFFKQKKFSPERGGTFLFCLCIHEGDIPQPGQTPLLPDPSGSFWNKWRS